MMVIEFSDNIIMNYSRRVANGILAYAQGTSDLRVHLPGRKCIRPDQPPAVDGIIAQGVAQLMWAQKQGIPAINIGSNPIQGIPQVCNDNNAICDRVVEHFKDRNFRTLAMLAYRGYGVTGPRKRAFIEACEKQGFIPYIFQVNQPEFNSVLTKKLASDLRSIPKPAGMLLSQDSFGPPVYNLCSQLGINIPQDLALVGVNNSVDYSDPRPPKLSSVDNNAERIGYEAAATLAKLIKGEPVPSITRIPPRELIVRQSSDITVNISTDLLKAIDFIRRNFHEDLELEDIVRQQRLGRRALEKRFKEHFNEPPMTYLRNLRLEKSKSLLETTRLPVKEISQACGIQDNNYFSRIFREAYGTTPLAYRRRTNIKP